MTDQLQTPAETTPSTASTGTSTSTPTTTDPTSANADLGADIATTAATTETPAVDGDLSADIPEPKAEGEKEVAPDPYADFRGPPEDGEYGDYVMPDGAVAAPELKAEFDPLVKELGLSKAGAQKLVDFKTKLDQQQVKNWEAHLASLTSAAQKDPEIGGLKFAENVNTARAALGKFGTPEFKNMLRDYGVGRHPEMIRFLSKIARVTGETTALGEGGGPVAEKKPLYERMYSSATKE